MSRATLYTLTKSDINVRPGQYQIVVADAAALTLAYRVLDIRQYRDRAGNDSFFAVDDEVQRIADILFDAERRKLQDERYWQEQQTNALRDRIDAFNARPWWRRLGRRA